MASVRAYKIAEELGIDRTEFVERARELGIDLKNAMASVDDDQAALLRDKLGTRKGRGIEARLEAKGASVIRRRKRAAPGEPAVEIAPELDGALPSLEVAAPEPETAPPTPEIDEQEPETEPEVEDPVRVAPAPAPEPARPRPAPAPAGAQAPRTAPPAPRTEAVDPEVLDRKGSRRKQVKEVVNLREQEQMARQVTARTGARHPVAATPGSFGIPRRRRTAAPQAKPRAVAGEAAKPQKRAIRVSGSISVAELARQLGAKAAELQGRLMGLGTMVSVNSTIDVETATRVARDYGFEVQDDSFQESEFLGAPEAADEGLDPRPPIVTVMGHVDHGKTSLLDAIREADVVAGEAGGITQHIGAYQAKVGESVITFIDTPGHAAFTAMRARGAQATDIVVLVVAATEGTMPQTVEAIDHARAAGVPIVVAINKVDLPDANPRLVRQRLMENGLVTEEFGGEVLAIDVSATKRTGLSQLLEAIGLQAELLELRADPKRRASGVVLEAQLDRGRGPVATVLVQNGTLRRGDTIVVGTTTGRVRQMLTERGDTLNEAGPSTPVQVIGLAGVPSAGDAMHAVENDRAAKQIIEHRLDEQRKAPTAIRPRLTLEELFRKDSDDGPKQLNVVIKADTDGSAEALRESLLQLPSDKVKLDVIHAAVGAINESDVQLAHASGAIVIGFHVRPDAAGRKASEQLGVDVRVYQIIYEVVDEVRAAMAGLLAPTVREVFLGRAEVRKTFTVPRIGTVAGSYVTEGLIRRNATGRLLRDGVQVFQGKFASLKRFKDDVREVQQSFECGIGLEGFNDVKVGDVIEAFALEEKPAEL
ncbi:MAG TPA: translation initiation factor IF-2 [Myxococcota bacterium]|nr:translation initiation factor IF-2 [Myxococcota bacterium]